MRRVMCTAAVAAVALATVAHQGRADTPQVPSGSLAIQQVSLFKNGLGYFTGQITCPPETASFEVVLPIAPSHGTFWLSYPADLGVVAIVARRAESGGMVDAITLPEILQANPDRKVRLTIGDRDVTGVIRYVARDQDAGGQRSSAPSMSFPQRYSSSYFPSYPHRSPEPPREGSLLIVETDAGELTLDPKAITQAMFLDGKAERRFAGGDRCPMLHVQLKNPTPGVRMTVSFLAKTVTWAPSYQVDISDASAALLSAKALIVNDACEFKGVETQLVTGFPHLQFADTASPVSLQQDLTQFLQALSAGRTEPRGVSVTSNIMTQSVSYDGPQDRSEMPASGASEIGQVAEDLFLYPAGRLDLGPREVAYVPLFTEKVPYKHVYQWNIPDYVNEQGVYEYARGQPGQEEEVWHGIRLTNTTRIPWTTAPGETVKNGVILGQDTLSYTPLKADNTLRITRAIGVKAGQREYEVNRKRGAARMYGWDWDLITVQGDLSITNFQDKAVDVEIAKTLSGEPKTADPQAKTERLAVGLRLMNGLQRLTWTLPLAPGENRSVTYTYEVYVRH